MYWPRAPAAKPKQRPCAGNGSHACCANCARCATACLYAMNCLLRIGAAKPAAGRAFSFVEIDVPDPGQPVTRESFRFRLNKTKLKEAEWRDGHYLLRSNVTAGDPELLWTRYVQLTQIESAFRSLKSELRIRPIYHQLEHRADAHILIAFLAYCLQVIFHARRMTIACRNSAGSTTGAI
jgi:hypothetical protein